MDMPSPNVEYEEAHLERAYVIQSPYGVTRRVDVLAGGIVRLLFVNGGNANAGRQFRRESLVEDCNNSRSRDDSLLRIIVRESGVRIEPPD